MEGRMFFLPTSGTTLSLCVSKNLNIFIPRGNAHLPQFLSSIILDTIILVCGFR